MSETFPGDISEERIVKSLTSQKNMVTMSKVSGSTFRPSRSAVATCAGNISSSSLVLVE